MAMNRLTQQSVRCIGNTSGLRKHKFDYQLESKIDHGHFPEVTGAFRKTLGEDYDTKSKDHLENLEAMLALNRELDFHVEQQLMIPQKEQEKMKEKDKFSPFIRINKILDRGSPFLEIG